MFKSNCGELSLCPFDGLAGSLAGPHPTLAARTAADRRRGIPLKVAISS